MRYVPYSQQVRDAETDEFKGIANTAFTVRPEDDGGLSLTWVEFYGPKSTESYSTAGQAFRDSLPSKKLNKKACFAIGNAGKTKSVASQLGKKIRIVHAPDGPNLGHVELHRFSDDDRRLLDALALEVYKEHVPVSTLSL